MSIGLRVLLLLGVIDVLVAGPVRDFVFQRYVTPFSVLRDRTAGRNTSIFFQAVGRVPATGVSVAFVGDSTMNAIDDPDATYVPMLVRADLRSRLPDLKVDTIDASLLGLYGSSAALFVAKLLGRGADVIVYGVTPRAFPAHPKERWVSSVSSELDRGDLERIAVAGGTTWLGHNLDAEDLISGLIKSHWTTFAYRSQLRRLLVEYLTPPSSSLRGSPSETLKGGAPPATSDPSAIAWPRAEYAPPNANWGGLEVIGQLCARYAPGRCILYASPINPLLRNRLYEADLYEEYSATLRVIAGRYGMRFRDYTDALTANDFRKPKYPGRDPIHMNPAGRQKLAQLLLEPIAEAIEATQEIPGRKAGASSAALEHRS